MMPGRAGAAQSAVEHAAPAADAARPELGLPAGWRRLLVPITHRVSGKIIGPYLVIVILLAVFATYVVMNLVTDSLEQKFRGELADAGRAANEAMVKLEADHLRVVRQMAFTEGVAEQVRTGRSEQARALLAPIAVNAGIGFVDLVDANGNLLLALRPRERADQAGGLVDRGAAQWPVTRAVLDRQVDPLGDKYSAVIATAWGPMLYTAGPIKQGPDLVGVVLVGTPLEAAAGRLSQEAGAGVTLYGPDGRALASSIPGGATALSIEPALYQQLMRSTDTVQQRQVSLGASRYLELLGQLEVRRQPAFVLGVSQTISLIADKGAETRNQLVLLFSAVILVVLGAGLALARILVRPLKLLVEACRAMAAGDLACEVPVVSSDETALLTRTFNDSLRGLRERDRAREAFGRYLSPELYEAVQRGELKLGGEKRVLTVLISDIRGFTPLAESMAPELLVTFLNRYFESQVAAIQRHGGVVDKFMGDSILAKFGAPIWYPDHARRAVLAMLDMRAALADFNRQLERYGFPPLRFGIGVHTGPAVVGNIGSTARMEYTIIGDTVNVAQRIEDLTKQLECDLALSGATYAQAQDLVEVWEPIRATLRGRNQESLIYPVRGPRSATGTAAPADAFAAPASPRRADGR